MCVSIKNTNKNNNNNSSRITYKNKTITIMMIIKMVLREFCKQLKFDHAHECYILKPKSVRGNKNHKMFRGFEKK